MGHKKTHKSPLFRPKKKVFDWCKNPTDRIYPWPFIKPKGMQTLNNVLNLTTFLKFFIHCNEAKQNKGFISCNPTVRSINMPTVTNFINILKRKKKK